MIRAVGPRAVIRPVDVAPRSSVIALTDHESPTVGEVLSVGRRACERCEGTLPPTFQVGDIVLVPPFSGQDVEYQGETLWIVRLDDIIGYWQEEQARA